MKIAKENGVYFLSWGCPWPPRSGGDLRTLGLMKEISRKFKINIVVLLLKPLENNQVNFLRRYANKIYTLPLYDIDNMYAKIIVRMIKDRVPYHCALLRVLFEAYPSVLKQLSETKQVIYASYGHWGTICQGYNKNNWILDQHNADIDFWRVYSNQNDDMLKRIAARINWVFARTHFPKVYRSVAKIVSVCEEDKLITLKYCPNKEVHVIENGVYCDYYIPERGVSGDMSILFTGTSAKRNMIALKYFVNNIFPLVLRSMPYAQLVIAGNFDMRSINEFSSFKNIIFTGPVQDIRPFFNRSSVFIAPFKETHGSKLKIAEAMAMAIPIVSTAEGIRGFKLVNGHSVLIGNSENEFADHIITILKNKNYGEKIGNEARAVALRTIDWKLLGERVRALIESIAY